MSGDDDDVGHDGDDGVCTANQGYLSAGAISEGDNRMSGPAGGGGGRYPIVARSESVGGGSGRFTPKVKSSVVVGGKFHGPAFEGPVSDGPGPAFGCCQWDSWAWPTPFGGSPILVPNLLIQYFASDSYVSFELSGTSFGGPSLGRRSPKLVLDQYFEPESSISFGFSVSFFGGSGLGIKSPKLVLDQYFVPDSSACSGSSDRRCSRSAGLWMDDLGASG